MIIGSISENKNIENRISITPEIAKKYISNGFQILLEIDYGLHLGISNDDYVKEGCKIDSRENILKQSDILLQLNFLEDSILDHLKENHILIGNFNSIQNHSNRLFFLHQASLITLGMLFLMNIYHLIQE